MLRCGGRAYRDALQGQRTGFRPKSPLVAPVPSDVEIGEWLVAGGTCLRVKVTRRWRQSGGARFGLYLDGSAVEISQLTGHPLLLGAGEHAIKSQTRSTFGRYFAALDLHAGEDVLLTFSGGPLDSQTGRGWTGLSLWANRDSEP